MAELIQRLLSKTHVDRAMVIFEGQTEQDPQHSLMLAKLCEKYYDNIGWNRAANKCSCFESSSNDLFNGCYYGKWRDYVVSTCFYFHLSSSNAESSKTHFSVELYCIRNLQDGFFFWVMMLLRALFRWIVFPFRRHVRGLLGLCATL